MSDDNPLALGAHYCPHPSCGAQLDSKTRPCPFGPHDEEGAA